MLAGNRYAHGNDWARGFMRDMGMRHDGWAAAALAGFPDPAAVRDSLRTQKSLGNLLVVSWHPANVLQAHLNLIDKKDDFRMLWF